MTLVLKLLGGSVMNLRSLNPILLSMTLCCAPLWGCAAPSIEEEALDETTDAISAGGEVQLVEALTDDHINSPSQQRFVADILVKNLAYQKQITVHMLDPQGGGQWIDIDAQFVESVSNNKELWRVSKGFTTSQPLSKFQFAVRYGVAGQTYWDSNGGQNYTLSNNYGGYQGVYLPASTPVRVRDISRCRAKGCQDNTLQVDLRNLGYQKQVSVAYSVDNWATVQSAPLVYQTSTTVDGIEHWTVKLPPFDAAKLAVSYTVNGTTVWDNNFGLNHDYNLVSSPSSLIATWTL